MPITPSNVACAPLARICAMTFRSIPPAKSFLPLVMMMPLTLVSASALSTMPDKSWKASVDITFIDLALTSHVRVTTPSASWE